LALAVGFDEAIERIGILEKAPLVVLPAAFHLASEPFSRTDMLFGRYYTKCHRPNIPESFSFLFYLVPLSPSSTFWCLHSIPRSAAGTYDRRPASTRHAAARAPHPALDSCG
jgi:hypothetical protein